MGRVAVVRLCSATACAHQIAPACMLTADPPCAAAQRKLYSMSGDGLGAVVWGISVYGALPDKPDKWWQK